MLLLRCAAIGPASRSVCVKRDPLVGAFASNATQPKVHMLNSFVVAFHGNAPTTLRKVAFGANAPTTCSYYLTTNFLTFSFTFTTYTPLVGTAVV